jgi:hypothetical protein
LSIAYYFIVLYDYKGNIAHGTFELCVGLIG